MTEEVKNSAKEPFELADEDAFFVLSVIHKYLASSRASEGGLERGRKLMVDLRNHLGLMNINK